MVDPTALAEIVAIVVSILGGQEGLKYVKNKARNSNGGKFVTEQFCKERHGYIEKTLDEVRADVKSLLQRKGDSR